MHTSPPHLVFFFMQRTTLIGRGREGGWEFNFRPSISYLSLFSLLLRLFFDCARERQVYRSALLNHLATTLLPCDFNILWRFPQFTVTRRSWSLSHSPS